MEKEGRSRRRKKGSINHKEEERRSRGGMNLEGAAEMEGEELSHGKGSRLLTEKCR